MTSRPPAAKISTAVAEQLCVTVSQQQVKRESNDSNNDLTEGGKTKKKKSQSTKTLQGFLTSLSSHVFVTSFFVRCVEFHREHFTPGYWESSRCLFVVLKALIMGRSCLLRIIFAQCDAHSDESLLKLWENIDIKY